MERFKMPAFFLALFALILCIRDVTAASYCYYSYYYSSYRCTYYYYYYYYSDSAGVIAGAVIGGLFGLAVIIGIIVFICVAVCKCKTTGVRGRVVQPNVGVSNTVTYIQPPTTYNGGYGYNGAPPMNAGPQMPPAYTNQAPPSYSQPPPPEPQYNEPAYPPNPPPQYNNVISGAPPNSHNYR